MAVAVEQAVFSALGQHLGIAPEEVARRRSEGLDALGLDSHGLLRVLMEVERALGLGAAIELPDEALDSPATLVAGIAALAR